MEKQKQKKYEPVPPEAPPKPWEAEREEAEPFAVARDKQTTDDAFMPTSAPLDARDEEVARKYRDPQIEGSEEP